ncbi:uroporphyrinogen decarboxylase [Heliobacterium gestii]|uniref:Uroporphyrinogen decarboxylase n=1 Tax=Heliomicrobium gestii TaxID=2699 RepID=A0A845LBH4_HELGE|nr:uroporphyrinogen decarboxylase family protein [Heliomicrobium gestii]MBM7865615.1 uroporphyrinogen decarboxylase [Heliomicrobium gestii]MZP41865.1 uroporphyrinogen decarboxylase [Heliomicrobium gestii]
MGTDKEMVLSTIRREPALRPAVALLSGGAWTLRQRGLSLQEAANRPDEVAQIIAETNEVVRSDIVWPGSGYHNLVIQAVGGRIKYRPKGTPDVIELLVNGDETPEKLQKIDLSRIESDDAIQSLWKMTEGVRRRVGDRTLVGSSIWGPFTLAGLVYGVERFMYSLYKDVAAAHAVLEFTTAMAMAYLEGHRKAGAEILSVAEPTASGDMISKKHFTAFALPYITRLMTWIHEQGAAGLLHICGNITDRLSLIPSAGVDVLSVDYKVPLRRVRETVADKIAFAGNVNPVDVIKDGTQEAVADQARRCLAEVGKDASFILMPGCDIPPDTPLENIRRFIASVKG